MHSLASGRLRRRVLVAEDEYVIALDIRQALEASGIDIVGPTAGLDDGLNLLDANPDIDGAVIDINLRGEHAYPLADALLARGVPFFFVTGYDRSSIPNAYLSVAVFGKPIEPALIVDALAARWAEPANA